MDKPAQRWSPGYAINMNGQERFVDIIDAAMDECPVSVISRHPEMAVLAGEVLAKARMEESGAMPYGADPNHWPAKWYDVVRLAEVEDYKVESAKDHLRDQMGRQG